jgi:hypothetical protein
LFYFILLFWWDWGLSLELHAYKAALYLLSHTSSSFFFGYFGDGGPLELFAWAGLELPSYQTQFPK